VCACDRLLVVLMVLLRQPRQALDGTANQISALRDQLRTHYKDAGAPYGDDAPRSNA